jgi:outer membrane lipoprotein-sorting protein
MLAAAGFGAAGARAGQPLTPAAVILRGEERFRSIRDYQCTVDIMTRLGAKVEDGSGEFAFKQPRMLRLKVTRGSGSGSEVAIDNQGQIRGRKRGLLSFVVKKLKAGDRRLSTIRGTSMLELDWGSFYLRYHAAALRPDAVIALAPHADPNAAYQVVVTYPDLGKSFREVYSLDPHQWTIQEGALYENDTLMEHVVFHNIRLDTGLTDDFFKL